MEETELKLVGHTITEATVDGSDVYLTLDDGTVFHYIASDGGYSSWEFEEAMIEDEAKKRITEEMYWENHKQKRK